MWSRSNVVVVVVVVVVAVAVVEVTVEVVVVVVVVVGGHASSSGMQSDGPLQARPAASGCVFTV